MTSTNGLGLRLLWQGTAKQAINLSGGGGRFGGGGAGGGDPRPPNPV